MTVILGSSALILECIETRLVCRLWNGGIALTQVFRPSSAQAGSVLDALEGIGEPDSQIQQPLVLNKELGEKVLDS